MCCCAIWCQNSTLNRLFGCVFLVWRHHLRKVNKSSVHTFRRFFYNILIFDVPQYSHIFHYIKDIRPAVLLWQPKNHCISSLTSFFRLSICALVPKIWPDKVVWWCPDGDFWRRFCVLYFLHVSDLHPKFAVRPHHVWKYGRHPICDGWD